VTQQRRYFYYAQSGRYCHRISLFSLFSDIPSLCVSCNNRNSVLARANSRFANSFSRRQRIRFSFDRHWVITSSGSPRWSLKLPEYLASMFLMDLLRLIGKSARVYFPFSLRTLGFSFNSMTVKSFCSPMTHLSCGTLSPSLTISSHRSRCLSLCHRSRYLSRSFAFLFAAHWLFFLNLTTSIADEPQNL